MSQQRGGRLHDVCFVTHVTCYKSAVACVLSHEGLRRDHCRTFVHIPLSLLPASATATARVLRSLLLLHELVRSLDFFRLFVKQQLLRMTSSSHHVFPALTHDVLTRHSQASRPTETLTRVDLRVGIPQYLNAGTLVSRGAK